MQTAAMAQVHVTANAESRNLREFCQVYTVIIGLFCAVKTLADGN
jgi:hypothetical protein